MTKDDIIRIYSQVSDELCNGTEWCWAGVGEPLQRFAELVAAAEREASQERINSLYKLYEQAAQQRDKLMEQQAYTVRALDTIRTLRKLKEENGG